MLISLEKCRILTGFTGGGDLARGRERLTGCVAADVTALPRWTATFGVVGGRLGPGARRRQESVDEAIEDRSGSDCAG